MSDQKPREFWRWEYDVLDGYGGASGIENTKEQAEKMLAQKTNGPFKYAGRIIHVIEKSAYDNLLAHCLELEKVADAAMDKYEVRRERDQLRADLDLAIEALKFYASGEHLEADDFDTETLDQGDFDLHENTHGKLARETLAKLQERK